MQWQFDRSRVDAKEPRPKAKRKTLKVIVAEDDFIKEGDVMNKYIERTVIDNQRSSIIEVN